MTFFVLLNAAFFGLPLVPLLVPVLQCFAMPGTTVLCNFGVLQRNLSFDWLVFPALPLASVAMFIIFGAAFGRALCGWVCPLGFFQDVIASVGGFFKIKKKLLSQKLHFMLTSVKYMVLFVTLSIVVSVGAAYASSWLLGKKYAFSLGVCGHAPYCIICPAPTLFVAVPSLLSTLLLGTPFPELSFTVYIGFAILTFLIGLSLVKKRFWCGYICPLGALMSLFNKFSLLHIKKKAHKCTTFCRGHQKDCNNNCPMGIDVSRDKEPSSNPECIFCYNCAESCSHDAVKYHLG